MPVMYNILVCGSKSTPKTLFINTIITKDYTEDELKPIFKRIFTHQLFDGNVDVTIYDTSKNFELKIAGLEENREKRINLINVPEICFDAVIFLFDVSDETSIEEIGTTWNPETKESIKIKKYGNYFLVATNIEKRELDENAIDESSGKEMAKILNCKYLEVDMKGTPSEVCKIINLCLGESLPEFEEEIKVKKFGKYDVIKPIKRGGFGQVFLCKDSKERIFALKRIACSTIDQSNQALDECSKAMKLDHPNICKHYESFIDVTDNGIDVIIVMEFFEDGDLDGLLEKVELINEKLIIDIAIQVIDSIRFLHENHILHRDIKPGNILLRKVDDSFQAVITDFGLAKKYEGQGNMSVVGTNAFAAIEVMMCEDYSYPVDVFSFGVLLYYLMTKQEKTIFMEILMGGEKFYEEMDQDMKKRGYSNEIRSLIISCMLKDPSKRPKPEEILEILKKMKV